MSQPVAGSAGVIRRCGHRGRLVLLLAGLAALYALRWGVLPIGAPDSALGAFSEMIRLVFVFACGSAFHLLRDRIAYTARGACLAGALLVPLFFSRALAAPALAILGGYLIFWFALAVVVSGRHASR